MLQERRAYKRFNSEASLILKPQDGSSRTIMAEINDISFDGMGVHAREEIRCGSSVSFNLVTKWWHQPIIGEGAVIYTREEKRFETSFFRIGFNFITVDKKAIQHIVNRIQEEICSEVRRREQAKAPPQHPRHA